MDWRPLHLPASDGLLEGHRRSSTPDRSPKSAPSKKATKSKGTTGSKRRKVNPPEDSPKSGFFASSTLSRESNRRPLPDIDNMTQEQAHSYFSHNAEERAWEHVELHKDMERLVEGNQLSPNSTVFTHDLRDMEVQISFQKVVALLRGLGRGEGKGVQAAPRFTCQPNRALRAAARLVARKKCYDGYR